MKRSMFVTDGSPNRSRSRSGSIAGRPFLTRRVCDKPALAQKRYGGGCWRAGAGGHRASAPGASALPRERRGNLLVNRDERHTRATPDSPKQPSGACGRKPSGCAGRRTRQMHGRWLPDHCGRCDRPCGLDTGPALPQGETPRAKPRRIAGS